jgi:replicative superfamily II helicase
MKKNMQNLPPLKDFQKTTLFALNQSKHVICISPTGSGKSRIFQQHLLENPNLKTILFSPLNALARQHEQQLKQLNIVTRLGIGSSAEGPPSGAGVWIVNPEQIGAKTLDQSLKIY